MGTTVDGIEGSREKLLITKLSDAAKRPTRGSRLSAGYDLYAAVDTVIPARGKGIVKTGIAIKCPENTYGRVAPRSGLAWKHSIDVGAGVIDADYRGEVGVILFNLGSEDFIVKVGDRIAQLILERCLMADIAEVDSLDETQRGVGGFGSTGVSNVENTTDTLNNDIGKKRKQVADSVDLGASEASS